MAVWAPLLLYMLRGFPRASCSLHVRVLLLLRCTHHRWVPTNHASLAVDCWGVGRRALRAVPVQVVAVWAPLLLNHSTHHVHVRLPDSGVCSL